jgi:hypothetical protein
MATIAQTTPAAASHESRLTSHETRDPRPQTRDPGMDLTWILVGIGAAAVLVALFRGRKRLRTLLG